MNPSIVSRIVVDALTQSVVIGQVMNAPKWAKRVTVVAWLASLVAMLGVTYYEGTQKR